MVALVLGSGLGYLASKLRSPYQVSFLCVPELGATSFDGHAGLLVHGYWGAVPVLAFQGRLHRYEGHPWRNVVMPARIAHLLGARIFFATNAAGGIADQLTAGSLMTITDHLDWTRPKPWLQPGAGPLTPDRPSPYSLRLQEILQQVAARQSMDLAAGVYAQVLGPPYETPSEVRALKACGADAVGMSTAREIETAHGLGMECVAMSCITNQAAGLSFGPIHHGEVVDVATRKRHDIEMLLNGFFAALDRDSNARAVQ